jgi:hypothetical protein
MELLWQIYQDHRNSEGHAGNCRLIGKAFPNENQTTLWESIGELEAHNNGVKIYLTLPLLEGLPEDEGFEIQ